jgi:hypothetical protein
MQVSDQDKEGLLQDPSPSLLQLINIGLDMLTPFLVDVRLNVVTLLIWRFAL